MKIALIHEEYRFDHLEKVMEEMRTRGAPRIRAIWCEDRQFWVALEGCHRLRAAHKLGLDPIIVPVEYKPGMSWADIGKEKSRIAMMGRMSIDELMEHAGQETVLGFGADRDRLPAPHEVRRPQEGEIMKYRIIKPINFDFGDGVVIGGVGTELTTEQTNGQDVTNYVSMGFLEIVEDELAKTTKEVRRAPYVKRGGNG